MADEIYPTTRIYVKRREDYYSRGNSYGNLIDLVESELDVLVKKKK